MEANFLTGAGFNAGDLNLFFRGVIASLICIWAVWTSWKQFQLTQSGQLSYGDWFVNVVKAVFIMTLLLIIVGA